MFKWLEEEDVVSLPEALFSAITANPRGIALDYVLKVHPVRIGKLFKFNLVIGKRMSYEELGKLVKGFADFFSSRLLWRDFSETIAIFTLNCPQFWGVYFGAQISGATPALISLATIAKELRAKKPIEEIKITAEIREQILDAKPRIIVATDFLWPLLSQLKDELGDTTIILTRLADTLPFYWRKLYKKAATKEGRWIEPPPAKNVFMLNDVLKKIDLRPWSAFAYPDKEQVAHLIYTGGTTGIPKGAMSSHANVLSNIFQCRDHLGEYIQEGDRVLGTMPFFHSYGLIIALMSILNVQGPLIFPPTFEPKGVVYLLKKKKIQILGAINRMFKALLAVPALGKLPDLKLCISGAGKLDKNVKDEFERQTGAKIFEGYGLTEASPVVSVTLPCEDQPRTIGRPLPGTEVKIVDLETRKELGPGEIGEILIRGPQVMIGYYKKLEETAKILVDGWLRTGDTAYRDEKGFLYFVGREKEMSKINGENVFWLDVERHFLLSEAVDQKCAVVGVPRPGYEDEQMLVVFVVLGRGKTLDDLKDFIYSANSKNWLIKKTLAVSEKVFSEWEDAIGKVQKKKVKKYYEEQL
ncbi:MAG: hypothetical protein A2750_01370 [Candidatus Yanofskybacteria bacterium RIFCSPHIGHO2_01_FULL_45_42]|uniref:AMP-dependent synthetase/ligase domain-containing protein n=1 Tax=Candidatus Yanofskybacteria bacterium RIFCSPHIGHO2_01_FULL_45_42 TaxID=1802671 RepID=A0A1F8F4L4_9BACT|nr:MAG: hypothetical protein A2750_01370 [Candidatus Yanofskybacteria bacterium RIFCSPHIGHO2_01_FULL_45_42]OGY63891.1 MAG: hypothetical protein A3J53_03660 [Candidatus Harrisonbacteria bacterium RIFCSPHIGHO2_02_FULL_40_20]